MSQPPLPSSAPTPSASSRALKALTVLGQHLAGTHEPASAVELFARSMRTMLRPDGLLIVLTDPDTRVSRVVHNYQYANPRPDDPLVQLISTEGTRVLPHVTRRALEALGVSLDYPLRSWVGAPIRAVGHTIGAVSAVANTPGHFAEGHVDLLSTANAQLGMALENARLVKLLAGGKGEWEQTVDAIGQALCVVDSDGTIRRANRAFSVIAHIPVTAVAGRPWVSVLPEDWADPVSRALAAAGNQSQHELRSGSRVFTVSALTLGVPEGAAVLVFEDQTAKRRLQDQLIQSEKMSAIGQLIAGVAHDLNNPLASVVGFADYLVEEGDPPESMRHALEAIRHEAERAAAIVRNLLNFARKQEGKRRAQQIGPILETTITLLRNQLMASKVETQLLVDPDLADVDMDANQMQQVFVNLINNAAQTMRTSGVGEHIVIHATDWLDGVAVTVTDDGPGVPPEVADRIFEPFFTTKAEGEGTGLGLSICQGIIREHGGRITYAPRTERGAVFRVELPAGVPAHITAETAIPEMGKLRVLVVDDEPHILHYMRATLEAWGHTVEVASDGAAGLALATTQPFDVVITDLRMPDPGGRELFEALQRDHPEVAGRVVFATGDTVGGDTLAFLESSGRPYLRKPFTLAELRRALGKTVVGH